MNQLLDRFHKNIADHGLFNPADKLLVAVSGGVDSVVLLQLLSQLNYQFGIAHCNFQLRGQDSDDDEKFVCDLAEKYNCKFFTRKFDTSALASDEQISTQMAARQLRYSWFDELMEEHTYDYLLTAHHADDQIETILFNLTKGTGVAGMRGFKVKNEKIIRPLHFASKRAILDYAQREGIKWREDQSNQSEKYQRNKIRHDIIPVLKEINPGLEQSFHNNIARFDSLEQLLTDSAAKIKTNYLSNEGQQTTLDLSWFDQATGSLVVLLEIIKAYGFNLAHCQGVANSINESGKEFFSDTHRMLLDRTKLIIEEQIDVNPGPWILEEHAREIVVDEIIFEIESIDSSIHQISKNAQIAQLDLDKIQFPISIRRWKLGDKFYPLGMVHQKKLSDFMIDAKIPVNLKKRLLVFESNSQIIWIAGQRIDDRFKVTDKTKKVYLIKMHA